jgi:hypothetical protein
MIRVKIAQIIDNASKAIKRFKAIGRPGETIENREYFQHGGFTSRPRPEAQGIVIKRGDVFIMIASDDPRHRPPLASDGDAALHADTNIYVMTKANGEIEIKTSGKVKIDSGNIEIGDGTLRKLVDERICAALNSHFHLFPANGGAPTSTPMAINQETLAPIPLVLGAIAIPGVAAVCTEKSKAS